MKDKEIEIKLRVEDNRSLLGFLEKNAELVSETFQRDEYFTPAHRNFLDVRPVKEWFRLREEDKGCSLNYKHWHYDEDGKTTYHCDEYEVSVGDSTKARNILIAVGLTPLIVVAKKRKTFLFGDYEVSLDTVEGLGEYVEVEYKGGRSDTVKIAEEMRGFVERTGCVIVEQDLVGYPFLLLEKKYGGVID